MSASVVVIFCLSALFMLVHAAGGVNSKLSKHGVDEATQRAISGMTKAGLSHDKIVQNMRNHFPDKRDYELNDIVIASNIAQETKQARGAGGSTRAQRRK